MRTKSLNTAIAATSLVLSATNASSATFDIQLNFVDGLTISQQDVVTEAAAFWEANIFGYLEGPNSKAPPLEIDVIGEAFDGGWGYAYLSDVTSTVSYAYATQGGLVLNSNLLPFMETVGALMPLAMHEIAHVIGFGTLWSSNYVGLPGHQEVYVPGSGQYTGIYGLTAYQSEVDPTATSIPVELGVGPGTDDSHWDEIYLGDGFGDNPELMTGWLEPDWFVSDYTIASFADIGYRTSVADPIPVPPALALIISGFGPLLLLHRRKRRFSA